jgi:two-component system chemotaxis response regulator CheB
MDTFAPLLLEAVRNAAQTKVRRAHRLAERVRLGVSGGAGAKPAARKKPVRTKSDPGETPGLVLVGTSTGGPPALDALLEPLPEGFPWAVLVAQHMPAAFTAALARRLDSFCPMSVVEVDRPMLISAGRIYIARGAADLLVSERPDGLYAVCAPAADEYIWHPSVDRLVESAIGHVAPDRLIGVLMTGMGDDGARTMALLRAAGGHTIAEAEETAVVWGMPGALVRNGGASEVAPLGALAERLLARVDATRPKTPARRA